MGARHHLPHLRARLAGLVRTVHQRLLLVMPLALVAAQLLGGERVMLLVAFTFPIVLALLRHPVPQGPPRGRDALTGLAQRPALVAALDGDLSADGANDGSAGIMLVEIDRFGRLQERHGHAEIGALLREIAVRLRAAVPEAGVVARLEGPCFALALPPAADPGMEGTLRLAGKVQRAVAEPVRLDGFDVHVTCSIGFALSGRTGHATGEALVQAATAALVEAQRSGPSAVRSYSAAMRARISARDGLAREVEGALDAGDIGPVFQPQIAAATGAVSGMEALARWHHPRRGLIPPAEFLPALEHSGLMRRLGEIMVAGALGALHHWDERGFDIPRVGVNFSPEELSDPHLVDRIGWELDRQEIRPERLVVEVLETVVANRADDMVIRNLSGLAQLGCCLDLDDFGTGQTSITSIRRFSIARIKIDRSFVTGIDADAEQQRMLGAILTMAGQLGLETLAEGVETPGERAMLAGLGCGHLQGFGISRPLPLEQADDWIARRQAGQSAPVRLHRQTG